MVTKEPTCIAEYDVNWEVPTEEVEELDEVPSSRPDDVRLKR
jgi:hypothetical protein